MSFRLIVPLVLAITLVSLLFAVYQVETENRSKRNELERRAEILAESLQETVEALREEGSQEKLHQIVEKFGSRERLAGIVIYSSEGQPVLMTSDLAKRLGPEIPPLDTAVFQGKMFFAASDGTHGTELWETDGTAAGTSLVSDINSGPAGSNLAALTVFNGKLYFQATAGAGGSQLFASDGTAAGTGLVKVLNPAGNASPFDFTAFGGSLFFAANDGTSGTQLL